MPTQLVKDLLKLPDHVRRGDFVLKLTEGLERADETLGSYVVTPQLVECFDQALSLIQSALTGRTSKACYLHGSFGCGKSHFMAVLDLILQGNTHARSIPELAAVINKHNAWVDGKRFLQVPIHMIGGESMEEKILGGYVEQVRGVHPDAPTPAVFRSDEILADAQRMRERMGDAAFFESMSDEDKSADAWGDLDSGWNAERFENACSAPAGDGDRGELVSRLIDTFYSAVRNSGEFIDLDHGLSVMSQHAADLGYDGIVLFLDELILWLASHSADIAFVSKEGQKLAKLVEAQAANRPVPLISFVARQRDLKDLVGDNVTGADYVSFSDVLGWWEARFATIKLEDRNLPAIAEKRVLAPVSEEAKKAIDKAFEQTASTRDDVMKVLLTSQYTTQEFRRIYPFTPAFMDMLVEMSFLLQRDRTALKVMLQLLIDQKETLKLGDVVPVGDLFDYIAEGDEAVSDDIKHNFDNAKRLYEGKFRPVLELAHGRSIDELPRLLEGEEDAALRALYNDDRLVKTLLLAALAPNMESFQHLTANRLAALNHGTIRSPIPGREGALVLQRCQQWARQIAQLKMSDDSVNPGISVHLTGVDTESIIEAAQTFDNRGNQVRMLKRLLFRELGVTDKDSMILMHSFNWRGTKRECQISFGNVREMPEEALVSRSEQWLVVIDLPFDEPNHSPADDRARLSELLQKYPDGTRTIILLPSFLGQRAQQDLGKLVILDNLLRGATLNSYTSRLTEAERHEARSLLENQHTELERHFGSILECAYGIRSGNEDALDTQHELEPAEHFQTLDSELQLRPPASANLREGMEALLDQALSHQYPAHPRFEPEARLSNAVLRKVYGSIREAAESAEGRALVEKSLRRDVRAIIEPLQLGEMGEDRLVLGYEWQRHFLRKQSEGEKAPKVQDLRQWIDEPKPMGLPRELQNLVIMTFAVQNNCTFALHGGSCDPAIGSLPDEAELRTVELPGEMEWKLAQERAGTIFGVAATTLLNATNVAKVAQGVREVVAQHKNACFALRRHLKGPLDKMGIAESADRYQAAVAAEETVQALDEASDAALISALAALPETVPFAAVGSSLRKAEEVRAALDQFNWHLLDTLDQLPDDFVQEADAIRSRLLEALESHEYAVALSPVLLQIRNEIPELANRALAQNRKSPKEVPEPPSEEGKTSRRSRRSVEGDAATAASAPAILATCGCLGSDYEDAAAFYKNDSSALERNRKLVSELKAKYPGSQIVGDALPKGIPADRLREILEVHHVVPLSEGGADSWDNMIVLSPTMHTLLHADADNSVDLEGATATIFGVELELEVAPEHLSQGETE